MVQKWSKTMNLKQLWNTAGYCLSRQCVLSAGKGEKTFSLFAISGQVGRKSVPGGGVRASEKTSVLWVSEMD
jgi:hypothetical protein